MAKKSITAESAVNESPTALVEAPDWAARSRLNALQPVSRLPAEVLSLIFLTSALNTRPTWFTRRHAQKLVSRKPGSGWLDVTQVCRAWRDASLGYPGLWSCADIPLHLGQEWARTFLTRSGGTPVVIALHPSDFEPFGIPEWAQNMLRAHLHRTTKLSVKSGELSSYRALENLGQEVPRLTSIVLAFVDSHALSPLSNVYGLLNAPMLRAVTLNKLTCNLSLLSWPNLRELKIEFAVMEPMDLLHALSTAPLLQDVILNDVVSLSHQHIQGQVKLNDLRRLVLHGDAAGILTSWKGLVLSPSASVAFIANQFSNDGEEFVVDIPTVIQLVQTQLLSVEGSGRRLVKYKLEIATGLFIVASIDFDRDKPFSDSRRDFDSSTLRLYIPSFAMPPQVDMPSCMHALPMASCEALDLNTNFHALPGSHPWTADAWPAIIPQTEHVKTLRISGLGALTLAKAAVTCLERDSNAAIFPNLQDLHLYNTSFAGSYLTLSAGDMPSFCVALVLWLNLRKQHGVTPIRQLVIRECNLYAEWLAPFEQFDDLIVDWDRSVGSCRGSLDEELADMSSDEETV